jgi:peptidoglycan/LPS O-acetylase OafA/YrhL
MDLIAFLASLTTLLAATALASALARAFGSAPAAGRFSTIDGLRGYLALLVFLHHSAIWYFHVRDGTWQAPPSNLFTLFGQGGVALFFMITAFLFFGRLLDARYRHFDWARLYVSRVLRLTPLYALAMGLLFLIVAGRSHWAMRDSLSNLARNAGAWLAFTFPGSPDLNGIDKTWITLAGVTWSLPYEWAFYFCLPILALLVSVKPPPAIMLLSIGILLLIAAGVWVPGLPQCVCFVGGIVAAVLVRIDAFRIFARTMPAHVLALACIVALVAFCPTIYSAKALLLATIVFTLIAGGCSLFGVLATPASRLLGDIAYSVYMLHGIALFLVFGGLLGASHPSPEAHWIFVAGLGPVLVALCFATFRLVEKPAMGGVPWLVARLRRHRAAVHRPEDAVASVPLS